MNLRAIHVAAFASLTFDSALTGCAGTTSTPRARVASELGCDAAHTVVQRRPDGLWQVSGCGRTATYLCTTPVRDCWRRGDIDDVQAVSSTPPNVVSSQ